MLNERSQTQKVTYYDSTYVILCKRQNHSDKEQIDPVLGTGGRAATETGKGLSSFGGTDNMQISV